MEGTAEYFTGRMTNAERKRTLADEILHDAEVAQYRRVVPCISRAKEVKFVDSVLWINTRLLRGHTHIFIWKVFTTVQEIRAALYNPEPSRMINVHE